MAGSGRLPGSRRMGWRNLRLITQADKRRRAIFWGVVRGLVKWMHQFGFVMREKQGGDCSFFTEQTVKSESAR